MIGNSEQQIVILICAHHHNKLKMEMKIQMTPSHSKLPKPLKSIAKKVVKQSTLHLYELYSNSSSPEALHSLYLQTLDLTSLICINLPNCGRDIVDITHILNNNLILGMKASHAKMVAAYAYLITKFLTEGFDSLPYYLNIVKTIATQPIDNSNNICTDNNNTTELVLACQNIKSLILVNPPTHLSPDADTLVERVIVSLGKIMCGSGSHCPTLASLDVEQNFYHTGLKTLKICKPSKRSSIYKQLLSSYFQYIDSFKAVPALDICKLTMHALSNNSEETRHSGEQASSLGAQDKRDEEITGFIIRKCFHLLRENYHRNKFFVEEHILINTINLCLSVQPYCRNPRTILVIFQSLFLIKKLELVTNASEWTAMTFEAERRNSKGGELSDSPQQQPNVMKICKYVSSCHLFLKEVVSHLSTHSKTGHSHPNRKEQEKQLMCYITKFQKSMRNAVPTLMLCPEQELMNMWNHIINNLNVIKEDIFEKLQRRHIVLHRPWILDWSFCADVQHCIITNNIHRRACDNIYKKLEKSNLFILIARQYLLPDKESFTAKFDTQHQHQNLLHWETARLCKQAEALIGQEKMFVYWDELISIGAILLESCGDVKSMVRVSSVLKELIKCKNMVMFGHNSPVKQDRQSSTDSPKCYRMSGLYNLMVVLIKPTELTNCDSDLMLTSDLRQHDKTKQVLTQSMLANLRIEKNKIKAELLTVMFRQFVPVVMKASSHSSSLALHFLSTHDHQSSNGTTSSEKQRDGGTPAYYDLFAYCIAVVPHIQSELTLEDKAHIHKTISEIILTSDQLLLNSIRYVYHKNVANLLRDYSHSLTTIHTTNNENHEDNLHLNKETQFKKKVILTNYLQFYSWLYSKNIIPHQQQTSQSNQQHTQTTNSHPKNNHPVFVTNKTLNYRRSSVYMREALQQFLNPPSPILNSLPSEPSASYSKILYIDFMYWVINYCKVKQLPQIRSAAEAVLEECLDGRVLQQFLVTTIKMCRRGIMGFQNKEGGVYEWIELIAECCNKLVYLSCESAMAKTVNNCRNVDKNSNGNRGAEEVVEGEPPSSSSTPLSSGGYEQISIEFEVQEACIHIGRINMLLLPFAKLLHQTVSCWVRGKGMGKGDWSRQFMMRSWWNVDSEERNGMLWEDDYGVKNVGRLIICLNNLIGFAHNIGHEYNPHTIHNSFCWDEVNDENSGAETNVLNILCAFKLMVICKVHGVWMCYHAYSQMVFMGHLPKLQWKIQEIAENISKYELQQGQESVKSPSKSLQPVLIWSIKLYLSLPSSTSSSFLSTPSHSSVNTSLKTVHILQTLIHMHPHKSLIRAMSGYIWTRNTLNEAALLKYEHPIMPITSSTIHFHSLGTQTTTESKIKMLWEHSSSQLQHSLLSQTLQRTLECLMQHGQLSELRSVLKLSFVYFTRSRYSLGVLMALQCYLARTKHTHYTPPIAEQHSNPLDSSADHLPKLDMLSIYDSMVGMLSCLHPINFRKKGLDKYCKVVLGTGNKRRTSMSFRLGTQEVGEMLTESLGKCGRKGAELVYLLGVHACKVLGLREEYIIYKLYAQLLRPYGNLAVTATTSDLKSLHDHLLKHYMAFRFLNFCHQIDEKTISSQPISPQQLQLLFIQQIRTIIPFSYNYANIVENMLSNTMEEPIDDRVMLELSVLMLDHNYGYKKMVEGMEAVGINAHDDNEKQCTEAVTQANNKYAQFIAHYLPKHIEKLDYLISSQLKYPLTIIYPLGERVYIFAVSSPLLVLHIDNSEFCDHINTVDMLIANNSRLLNRKNIDSREWWDSRDRVDRSIGSIANKINIPLWDIQMMEGTWGEISEKEMKVCKLVECMVRNFGNDLQKIKNTLTLTTINLTKPVLDDLIFLATSALSATQQPAPPRNENLLLLVHPTFTLFPFQSIALLRERALYRLPSIEYLLEQKAKGLSCKLVNINNLKYLVNAGNDLPETQRSFYKIKESYPQWKGIVGRKPGFGEYFGMMQGEGFLYMGHGAGSQHIKEKEFYGKGVQAFMMLFGCSSAAITQGKCEPNGIAHRHLMNGAPGLLGCLWEVTDKDTDKMTENMFKTITHYHHPQNLSRILNLAKRKCKHHYLNGGAVVIFGIPIYVHIN